MSETTSVRSAITFLYQTGRLDLETANKFLRELEGPDAQLLSPDTEPASAMELVQNDQSAPEPRKKRAANAGSFKAGASGNPNGRPVKPSRAFTDEQRVRDFVSALNRPIDVPMPGGKVVKMPASEAYFHMLVARTLKGEPKATALFEKWWNKALEAGWETNPRLRKTLRAAEKDLLDENKAKTMDNRAWQILNEWRKKTFDI